MTSCNDDDDSHTPHPTTKIAQSVQQDQIDHAELNGDIEKVQFDDAGELWGVLPIGSTAVNRAYLGPLRRFRWQPNKIKC